MLVQVQYSLHKLDYKVRIHLEFDQNRYRLDIDLRKYSLSNSKCLKFKTPSIQHTDLHQIHNLYMKKSIIHTWMFLYQHKIPLDMKLLCLQRKFHSIDLQLVFHFLVDTINKMKEHLNRVNSLNYIPIQHIDYLMEMIL